jgi:hypothetical protein
MQGLKVEKKPEKISSSSKREPSESHTHEMGYAGPEYPPPEQFAPLAAKLSHPANKTPRVQFLTQLQQTYGNRYVQNLVSSARSQEIEQDESKLASEILSQKSSGKALEPEARGFMEPRFGHDFSGVRIHTDSFAERTANDLGAEAFTIGRDIFFGAGRHNLAAPTGRRLLVHELTHTVQQEGELGKYRIQKQAVGTTIKLPDFAPVDNTSTAGYEVKYRPLLTGTTSDALKKVIDYILKEMKKLPAARAWYTAQPGLYTPYIIKRIQNRLLMPETGKMDDMTIIGIGVWQWRCNLQIDGKAGENTLKSMFGRDIRGDSPTASEGKAISQLYYPGSSKTVNIGSTVVHDIAGTVNFVERDDKDIGFWNQFMAADLSHWGGSEHKSEADLSTHNEWYAPAVDVYVDACRTASGYGGYVQVRFEDGRTIAYGHLTEISVTVHQAWANKSKLTAGSYIGGTKAKIGLTTGAHLHIAGKDKNNNKIDRKVWLGWLQQGEIQKQAVGTTIKIPDFAPVDKTSTAGYEARYRSLLTSETIGKSPQDVANKLINAFDAESSLTTAFPRLKKNDIVKGLRDRVDDPSKIKQASLHLCGPAAVAFIFASTDIVGYTKMVIDLYKYGEASTGSYTIKAGSDLRSHGPDDYKDWAKKWGKPEPVDWMVLSSMRDSQNWVLDFEGDRSETFSEITFPGGQVEWLILGGMVNWMIPGIMVDWMSLGAMMGWPIPGGMVKWLKDLIGFKDVVDETGFTKSVDHLKRVNSEYSSGKWVILFINSHMIENITKTAARKTAGPEEWIKAGLPDHYVVLMSKVVVTENNVSMKIWDHGEKPTIKPTKEAFESNYFGAIFAK